jgi:hypothetical protein
MIEYLKYIPLKDCGFTEQQITVNHGMEHIMENHYLQEPIIM